MHKEPPYEFSTGDSECLPLAFVSVVLDIVCDLISVNGDQPVIADRYAMGVLAKILDNRVGAIEGRFDVKIPLDAIALIDKILKNQ